MCDRSDVVARRVATALVTLAALTAASRGASASPASTRPCSHWEGGEACADTFVIRADGLGRRLLERNPLIVGGQPIYDVSRDLRWILVWQGGHVYSATVAARGARAYDVSGAQAQAASWSPDGTKATFMRGGGGSIWITTRSGSRRRKIANAPAAYPSWASDSRTIVFLSEFDPSDQTGVVTIGGLDRRGLRKLVRWHGGESPQLAWASRGGWIAYTDREGVKLVRADGRRGITIADASHPAWAPDGRRLAFLHQTRGGQLSLRVVNRDGSGGRVLDARAFPTPPVWSPNGSAIAYVRVPGRDLTLVRPSGARRVVLTHEPEGVQIAQMFWSHDSRRLAYARAV